MVSIDPVKVDKYFTFLSLHLFTISLSPTWLYYNFLHYCDDIKFTAESNTVIYFCISYIIAAKQITSKRKINNIISNSLWVSNLRTS